MLKRILCISIVCLAASVWADETVRQVQEELRKRNLYFGNVDGQSSPGLISALKRYQARKGFQVTGAIDQETSTSLSVQSSGQPAHWPDIPVLKSDPAPQLAPSERIALEKKAETNPDPSPAPPAESPPSPNVNPERITKLVARYLADAETNDIGAQTNYFVYPVTYFDHGDVGSAFVQRDVTNYVKRWPMRKYALVEPVTFLAEKNEGETQIEFTIDFSVRNQKYAVTGRTKNFWTVRPAGDNLKIVTIREERLRE